MTAAGGVGLNLPAGLAIDSAGSVYLADAGNHRVLKIAADGSVAVVAGGSGAGFSGDDGPAVDARLYWPKDVAWDKAGNLYIADSGNDRIRKVAPDGTISTVAGNGLYQYSGDGGAATGAALAQPSGVALDCKGNLYVADTGNFRVRKVAPDGTVSTVAGNGIPGHSGDGGPAKNASLAYPLGLKVDGSGNVLVADYWSVRAITPDGVIQTVAGNGAAGNSGDDGPSIKAQTGAWGLALGAGRRIYIADPFNSLIRVLTPLQ